MTTTTKLTNGLTVVLERMPYLKSVSFGVWVKVGSAYENAKNNGIAHMLEHMFFKGTTTRSAKDLADITSMIGGNVNAYTSKEHTNFYATTIDEYLPIAIDMISDMIQNSLFSMEELEKEKGVVLEEIDMYDDSAEDMCHEMLQREVWKEHPLGYLISGEKEIVRSFTREQLITFRDLYYTADNMVISIAGNYNEKETLEQLENSFGKLRATANRPPLTKPEYKNCIYKDEKDIEQMHINIAFPSIASIDESRYELTVMNAILGENANCMLFQRIREEMGLTYSIYSYESSFLTTGLFHIYAATNPEPALKIYEEVFRIIEQVKKTGFSEKDIEETKKQIRVNLTIASESTKNRMNSNAKHIMKYGMIHPLNDIIGRVNKVTKESVDQLANKILDESVCSVALVGNLDQKIVKGIESRWNQ
ncbi:M16 family metallopeptidase [Anaerosporobacter faecicola]|uniref:M16 family metallopeptidase n=1 Tax=Anaerosporobacter faecicola TaxID=2718714 RepID=UPI00143C69D6|nr:pitrilysin family protein [Anaerosporobacter faecicola]